MVLRVATFQSADRMLSASLAIQARTVEDQIREATGLVSTDWGGLGAAASGVLRTEVAAARAAAYAAAATTAGGRVEAMTTAVTEIINRMTELRTALSSASTGGTDTLADTAADLLADVVALLETRSDGRSLFAGGRVDGPAVDLDGSGWAPDLATIDQADAGYYAGDGVVASVRVSQDRVVSYGVTADAPAFEQALRALALAADPDLDAEGRSAVAALADEAVDALSGLQAGLANDAETLDAAATDQADLAEFLAAEAADGIAVDVTAVAARLAAYEAQLEASFAALAKITKLALTDYL